MVRLNNLLSEKKSKGFEIFNESGISVDYNDVVNKLKPYLSLVKKSNLPVKIKFSKKKNAKDLSFYDKQTKISTIKIDKTYSKKDIEFIIAHEFAHFLQMNNPMMFKNGSIKEQEAMHQFLINKFDMDEDQIYRTFHDIYPMEVFANVFAGMITNHYRKVHPFSEFEKGLRKRIKE